MRLSCPNQVADLLLTLYYDSMYEYQATKRQGKIDVLPVDTADALAAAEQILAHLAARGRGVAAAS